MRVKWRVLTRHLDLPGACNIQTSSGDWGSSEELLIYLVSLIIPYVYFIAHQLKIDYMNWILSQIHLLFKGWQFKEVMQFNHKLLCNKERIHNSNLLSHWCYYFVAGIYPYHEPQQSR